MLRTNLLNVVVALLMSSGIAAATDWTMFHGPAGDNKSLETGLLRQWGEGGPKLLWTATEIGVSSKVTGYGSASVAQGRVFLTGNVDGGGEKEATAVLYCLDEKNGQPLWTANIGSGWMGHYEGDRTTPTVDGDCVYAFTALGTLACFSVSDGKEIWKRDLATDFGASLPGWALAESVRIDGDRVIACPGGRKGSVVALDKKTGKDVWITPAITMDGDEIERAGYATGLIFTMNDRRIYVNMNQKGFIFVDPNTGTLLGRETHTTAYDVNATMPYYEDGCLYVTSGYGTTGMQKFKLTLSGDSVSCEQAWVSKRLDNLHGGVVFLDGYVYGAADKYKGGSWVCLRLSDGEEMWQDRSIGKGSVVFADGMLYGYSEKDGNVALIEAKPTGYAEVSRFQAPQEGRGQFWSHPVIANGKLFLRRDTRLYCYLLK